MSLSIIIDSPKYSLKKGPKNSLTKGPGTMPLTSNQMPPHPSTVECISYLLQKNKNNRSFRTRICVSKESIALSPPMQVDSSLLKRKMGSSDQSRTIGTSTSGPFPINICFHSFPSSFIRSLGNGGLQSLRYDGDTITPASKKAMNGRPPSKPAMDFSNQPSCSLGLLIPPPPFKP